MSLVEVLAPCKIFKIKMNLSSLNTTSTGARFDPTLMGVYKKEYSMTDTETPLGWLTSQQFRRNCVWFTRGLFSGEDSLAMRGRFTIKIPKRMQTFNNLDKLIFMYLNPTAISSYCLTTVINAYK